MPISISPLTHADIPGAVDAIVSLRFLQALFPPARRLQTIHLKNISRILDSPQTTTSIPKAAFSDKTNSSLVSS